jgi:hypothetical protein
MQERRVAARDLAVLRQGDDHAEQVLASEVVGRLIAWLLDPPVRQQVNALTQGELVVSVGPADLSGHTVERVKVVIVKPLHSAPA